MQIKHICLLVFSVARVVAFEPAPIRNFTQKLNHNQTSGETFQQQYQIDTTKFKTGRPIIFLQGAEDAKPLSPEKLYTNVVADHAAQLNGIVATLEHRYFGYSFPKGFNGSIGSYSALTLDNVLQDSVEFVKYIKAQVPGAENSTVLVAGGSYGGFLVTLLRMRYPDIFHGAFASSPVLAEWGPPAKDPLKYTYYEWLSNVYYDTSAEGSKRVKQAMAIFHECKTKGNCDKAIPDFNFCGSQPNASDYENLYGTTLFNYRYAAQYNLPYPALYPQPYPLEALFNATVTAETPGAVLRVTHQLMNNESVSTDKCIKWTNETFLEKEIGILGQSMVYIGCTYFPKLQDWVPEGNLFPAQEGNGCLVPEYESKMSNNSNSWWVKHLNLTQRNLDSVERLLIIQGQNDGTSSWGSPALTLSGNRNKSRIVLGNGLSHTEDTYSASIIPEGHLQQLDLIRNMKLQYAIEWAGLARGLPLSGSAGSSPSRNSTTNRCK